MTFLKLHNIKKSYSNGRLAFGCSSLAIDAGSKIGIAGETGSGKSTMLKVIGGLEKPEAGTATLEGETVYPKLDRLIPGHPEMAYLSQSFDLPKFITVREYLKKNTQQDDRLEAIAKLTKTQDLLDKDTRALSGGEKQRAALASILLKDPKVLLLDEPFSNLDPHHERMIKQVIHEISMDEDITILMVSHDPTDLLPWADDLLILKDGSIVQKDRPKTVYYEPKNAYVAGLLGSYQFVERSNWIKSDPGRMIVRPEQFQLNNHGKNGCVKEVYFHGAYELLSVDTGEEMIYVSTAPGHYQRGDKVGVSLVGDVNQEVIK